MRYKFCKFCENRARDTPLRGVYIPHFGQIWVKISILGVLHPSRFTDWGEIWRGGGDLRSPQGPLLHAKFYPHRCNVSPLRGEKPQNRPLSKLNTGRFALRAMLPVTNIKQSAVVHFYSPTNRLAPSVTAWPTVDHVWRDFAATSFSLSWQVPTVGYSVGIFCEYFCQWIKKCSRH